MIFNRIGARGAGGACMHEDFGAQPVVGAEPAALAPVEDYLTELHDRVSALTGGKPADYIPELGKVDPSLFGIAIATTDGEVYGVGDTQHPFTIQSVSKPFMYGYALNRYGREAVLKHVGVEPTGEAFNSIVLDEVANRPFNPMVNAGAIAVAELMDGASQEQRTANMLALLNAIRTTCSTSISANARSTSPPAISPSWRRRSPMTAPIQSPERKCSRRNTCATCCR